MGKVCGIRLLDVVLDLPGGGRAEFHDPDGGFIGDARRVQILGVQAYGEADPNGERERCNQPPSLHLRDPSASAAVAGTVWYDATIADCSCASPSAEHQLDGNADVVIIGGGIVGLATAMAITDGGASRVIVLEAEQRLAAHQTGRNSGVIHSGLYYRPESLKAQNCVRGREAMYRFCEEHGIAHERCGKVVVATDPEEIPRLDELERRGRANGLAGVRRLSGEEVREHEPHVTGVAGLLVPDTGIVDYADVAAAMARRVQEAGGTVHVGARVTGRTTRAGETVV
ncbi:FAD-dependent oxidoreductase, partial [Candidatus Poribacteria bacterium]|nr:FAD-dependent oxidoreductase [Candidatus Poribacteria bacterium]